MMIRKISMFVAFSLSAILLISVGWDNWRVSELIEQGAKLPDAANFFSQSIILMIVGWVFGGIGFFLKQYPQKHHGNNSSNT